MTPSALETFQLPIAFDLFALFAFAIAGTLAGMERRYDIVGVFFLGLISSIGGTLLRDGVFIQQGPPAIFIDARYSYAIGLGVLAGAMLGSRLKRFARIIAIIDALGLAAYTVYGAHKALGAGFAPPAALLVGVLNGTGGSIIRDVLTREEPLVFKPGQFYLLTTVFGGAGYLIAVTSFHAPVLVAAWVAIGVTFLLRILAIVFDWRTRSLSGA
ncbi:trimeric intracellular cation channel family protein [Nibricoccus sp. IMCC34717]|uniref:trimeric intracellular cation channel family protein n=1 Tax=Nibricoccus sp. IMCC34717 TaxID=3034021 RepID=UPI00384BE2EE